MWVFDGEEWTQDSGNEHSSPRTETPRPRYEEKMPELQVIEIVEIPRVRERPIVVPLPTP